MSAEEQAISSPQWPKELTPEEAAKLRAHHMAMAREMTLSSDKQASGEQDRNDSDATDATVAAFVLPGGE